MLEGTIRELKIILMKYIIAIFLLLPTFVFSQGWEKIFENGVGKSVQQTTDGGYIITGTYINYKPDIVDVYLIKTNENGDTLWTKTYGGNDSDRGCSVQQTTDGGYIITGNSRLKDTKSDVYLIKTNEDGDTLWTKTYGGLDRDYGYSVQQTTDGAYIITGMFISNNTGSDVYLIKTNQDGDSLWTKTYGGELGDFGYSVQQTTDGGYAITGSINSNNTGPDVCLIKTNEHGDTLWTKTFGGPSHDFGYSVQQTTDGGYIITGYTESISGNFYVYLIKTDENGDTLWTNKYSRNGYAQGQSVQQTSDGGYIISGGTISFRYNWDVYLIKTNENGDTLWTKTYGGDGDDYGNFVQQTIDGGYIITGYTYSFGIHGDIYLIKTDGNGNITTIVEIPTPNPNRKLIKVIDFSGKEIIHVKKNIPFIEIYDDGTTQKKIIK